MTNATYSQVGKNICKTSGFLGNSLDLVLVCCPLPLCRFYVTVAPGPWFSVLGEVCKYAACPTWLRNEAVTHPSWTHAARPILAAILPNNKEDISTPTEHLCIYATFHKKMTPRL